MYDQEKDEKRESDEEMTNFGLYFEILFHAREKFKKKRSKNCFIKRKGMLLK